MSGEVNTPYKPRIFNNKLFITADELLLDSYILAKKVWDDGYRPNFIMALWRGGTPPGIAIHEFFRRRGVEPYHTAIKSQSYHGLQRGGETEIKGLEHVTDIINSEDRMLIVDDVFDTGITIREVLATIHKKARKNTPEIRIATVFYKKENNETDIEPDYYLRLTNKWIVFPHELNGLGEEEIKFKDPDIFEIVCKDQYLEQLLNSYADD